MRKILFLFMTVLAFSNKIFAQEIDIGERAKQHRQELVKHQDELLEFLLQTPFEQRQYIFPMLSEKQSIPKKIKTHPDVLVWKGKRPTRIAKRFQNDPELLEYLPAQFYYFLAPEMWGEKNTETSEGNPHQLFTNFLKKNPMNGDVLVPSESLIQFKNGLDIIYASLSPQQKESLKKNSEIYMTQLVINHPDQVSEKLKKEGYLSAQSFAEYTDKIAQIYRQYKNGENPSISRESDLVRNYFSLIPYIFKKSGFEVMLNSEIYSD